MTPKGGSRRLAENLPFRAKIGLPKSGMRFKRSFVITAWTPMIVWGTLTAEPDGKPAVLSEKEVAKSLLIGKWVEVLCMGYGDLPTNVYVVTIGEDGVFHSVTFQLLPGKGQKPDEVPVKPAGAELSDYRTGKINLKTGEQELTKEEKETLIKSISWSVADGRLNWSQDMGEMGTSNFSYSRAGAL